MKKLILLLPFLAMALSACDPKEQIPSYIYVKEFQLVTDSVKEGTNSHKISDVWVSADNVLQGGFEMPVTVPILTSGMKQVILGAGIRAKGISTTRTRYPFYETWIDTIDLQPADVDTIQPVVRYNKATQFKIQEDFEDPPRYFDTTGFHKGATLYFTTNPDSAFGGRGAMVGKITGPDQVFQVANDTIYILDRGRHVWLEMNYKSDVQFEVGTFSVLADGTKAQQQPVLGINPTANFGWNKIYINLSDVVSNTTFLPHIRVYFLAVTPETKNNGTLIIDNVKLLYLE